MPRTQVDLVNELKATHNAAVAETSALVMTAMAIGFEEHTEFVFGHEDADEAVYQLTEMAQRDGEPIGILQMVGVHEGERGVFRCRPFAEYKDEEWADEYLFTLQADMLRLLASSGKIDPDSIQLDA